MKEDRGKHGGWASYGWEFKEEDTRLVGDYRGERRLVKNGVCLS